MSTECRSTYRPIHQSSVGWYVSRDGLSNCQPTCRSIGYRHSADTSLILAYWWLLVMSAEQRRYPCSVPHLWEASLYKPDVVNRTKPNQKSIEPNRSDSCSTGSVIKHNRTGTFWWVPLIELVSSISELIRTNQTQSTRQLCLAERQDATSFNGIGKISL